ncbi:MAG TPA: TfoX/Sxy family protein [Parvularculaceae bacterium]|nr:TfoX/Sxy family protein [Parvularculaceae bacterium]
MARPADLQKRLAAAAPPDVELQCKPMFGGIGAYAGGRMFASLSDAGLALKLCEVDRDKLLKLPGAKPLQYEPSSPPSKSYVVVPDAMLANRKTLRAWIEKSAAFVKAAPARPVRKKRMRSKLR